MDEKDQAAVTGIRPAANPTPHHPSRQGIGFRKTFGACALIIVIALTACSPSTPTTAVIPAVPITPQPSATPTLAPTATLPLTNTPAITGTPQQTATPTPIDPCVLIPSQEASTYAGASFGAGLEDTTSSGLRICTYGGQTPNVFSVDVIQAPDVATAQAAKAQFLADLQANLQKLSSAGLNITQLPNFADGATMATASLTAGGISVNGSAIGFLKGTVFVGFSDIVEGGPAPTTDAVQAEATTVLGRLP